MEKIFEKKKKGSKTAQAVSVADRCMWRMQRTPRRKQMSRIANVFGNKQKKKMWNRLFEISPKNSPSSVPLSPPNCLLSITLRLEKQEITTTGFSPKRDVVIRARGIFQRRLKHSDAIRCIRASPLSSEASWVHTSRTLFYADVARHIA